MTEDIEARELLQKYNRGEIDAGELEWQLMTEEDQLSLVNLFGAED